jgi:hypothetical protein
MSGAPLSDSAAASRISRLVATADTEQQLAWEKIQRPRAAAAAFVAAVLTLGSDLWTMSLFRGAPSASFVESLRNALAPGPIAQAESVRTPYFEFVNQHAGSFIPASLIKGLGYLALAYVLTLLLMMVRGRRPVPRAILPLPLLGALLTAIGTVLFAFAYKGAVDDFLAGPHTVERAYDAASVSLLLAAQVFRDLLGPLLLAAGLVFTALNAMRTGLLTRFMGILGIIIGMLQIVRLGPMPIVQTFWLGALGVLLLGRWPSGMPPAWSSGKEEPWPSQAAVAQQRREAAQARRGGRGGAAVTAPDGDAPAPTPASAKRKRKRR